MIGWLRGNIVDKTQPGKLVIDVQGVGYDVETSLNTFFKLDAAISPISLHIHTVVREDALLLYGFLDQSERSLFRTLIRINGIGPKSAIAILSSISPEDFVQCIRDEDPARLVKLPGIGKKTAERMLIELRDSLTDLCTSSSNISSSVLTSDVAEEAISALEALGYKASEARKVVKQLHDGQKSCEQLIRQSLQKLSGL